jgi:hypothetical protein
MAKRKSTAPEPGKPKPEEPGAPLGGGVNAHGADADSEADPETVGVEEPTMGMSAEQVAAHHANMAATAKLVGSKDALDWSNLNSGLPAAQATPNPDAGLPDFADPKTISRSVLTKAGWVVPENDPRTRGPR